MQKKKKKTTPKYIIFKWKKKKKVKDKGKNLERIQRKNHLTYSGTGASIVAQLVKNLPAVQETWLWSLGWEDPLQKEMATHSSILAWKSHGQRSLEGCSPWCCKDSGMTEQLTLTYYSGTKREIKSDFSETIHTRREWSEIFNLESKKKHQPRILYPTKLSFKSKGKRLSQINKN